MHKTVHSLTICNLHSQKPLYTFEYLTSHFSLLTKTHPGALRYALEAQGLEQAQRHVVSPTMQNTFACTCCCTFSLSSCPTPCDV